jgi:hypothetical protein
MKRPVFLVLLLTAVALLIPAFVLVGCSDLGGTEATTTTATSVSAITTVTSNPPPTAAANTTLQTPTTSAPAPVTARFEEDDSRLTWEGPWTFTGGADDSGGSCRYTEDPASSVTVKFSGTAISLISATGLAVGEIGLTLDSGNPFTVDCYSATVSYQAKVWSSGPLDAGTHYLKVECAGTCNPASGGTGIYVDAFDVTGTLQ